MVETYLVTDLRYRQELGPLYNMLHTVTFTGKLLKLDSCNGEIARNLQLIVDAAADLKCTLRLPYSTGDGNSTRYL